jgi:hypothetical protein
VTDRRRPLVLCAECSISRVGSSTGSFDGCGHRGRTRDERGHPRRSAPRQSAPEWGRFRRDGERAHRRSAQSKKNPPPDEPETAQGPRPAGGQSATVARCAAGVSSSPLQASRSASLPHDAMGRRVRLAKSGVLLHGAAYRSFGNPKPAGGVAVAEAPPLTGIRPSVVIAC